MSLIRYQAPELSTWPSFGRLSNLRDELDTLFELPFWSNFGRQTQLFSGWTPALDLALCALEQSMNFDALLQHKPGEVRKIASTANEAVKLLRALQMK